MQLNEHYKFFEDKLPPSATAFKREGVPGFIAITAPSLSQAFPLVLSSTNPEVKNGSKLPVAAAACCGRGRIVAFAHNGYVNNGKGSRMEDLDPFVVFCCGWAARTENLHALGGSNSTSGGFFFNKKNTSPLVLNRFPNVTSGELVLLWDGSLFAGLDTAQRVRQYVYEGGALAVGTCPWGYMQLNPSKTLHDMDINKVLQGSGLQFVSGYAHPTQECCSTFSIPKYGNATQQKLLVEACTSPMIWEEWKEISSKLGNSRDNAGHDGAGEKIIQDASHVVAAINNEIDAAKCCYGNGGWWATVVPQPWVHIRFQYPAAAGQMPQPRTFKLTKAEIHCVNVEASPKRIQILGLEKTKSSWALLLDTPFNTLLGKEAQNPPFTFELPPSFSAFSEVKVCFLDRHASHYVGVNNIQFYGHEVQTAADGNTAATVNFGGSLSVLKDLPSYEQQNFLDRLGGWVGAGGESLLRQAQAGQGVVLAVSPLEHQPLTLPNADHRSLVNGLLQLPAIGAEARRSSWFPGVPSAVREALPPVRLPAAGGNNQRNPPSLLSREVLSFFDLHEEYLSKTAAAELGWISTHAYAISGIAFTVQLSVPLVVANWAVRVGCHADDIAAQTTWKRWPTVSEQLPLQTLLPANGSNQQATTFTFHPTCTGPVFLVPLKPHVGMPTATTAPTTATTIVQVAITGCLQCPFADLNSNEVGFLEDSREADETIAPWGELRGRNVSIHLPRKILVQHKEHLLAAAAFWDHVVASHHELAKPPYGTRRERVVTDVQLCAGYMHSGYPIGSHLDFANLSLDVNTLENDGNWGMFHELGHNMQRPQWTWADGVEVTCNLFTLYTMERVCGKRTSQGAHMWFFGNCDCIHTYKGKHVVPYLKSPNFNGKLAKDYSLALYFFVELIEEFGWQTVKAWLASYHNNTGTMSNNGGYHQQQQQWTDQRKFDEFAVRFSQAAKQNCGGRMIRWGFPVSQGAVMALGQDTTLKVVAHPVL